MMTVPLLTTSRLLLRPLESADADAIQRVFPRQEIVRYLNVGIPWPYPDDGATTFVENMALPAMRAGRAWHWSLRLRTAPEDLIGLISLRDDENDNRGFWLIPEMQRQGLMTEACDCVVDFWFSQLKRPRLRAPKARNNIASRRISERSGMRLIKTCQAQYIGGEQLSELWEISREAWATRSS